MNYGGIPGWAILLLMGGGAIAAFAYQVQKATRLVLVGGPDNRFDSWGSRISEVLTGWLGQKKVLRDKVAGTMHVMMFWGFLMLASDMLDLATANFFSTKILPSALAGPWNGMVEFGYFVAMLGCIAAFLRRAVFTPEKLKGKSQLEGNFILFLIFTITTTSFIVESGESPSTTWEPFGAWVSTLGLGEGIIVGAYWAHMLAISTFLVLIPISKHMHLVMAFPNVFFHDMEPLAKMRPMAVGEDGKAVPLEDLDIETFGVSQYDQLTWRQLIDGWACTTCVRCQDVCPAYESGKSLNPMKIVHNIRDYANDYAPILLKGEKPEESIIARFTPEAIWACTTCHACVDACPVYIEHIPKITDARRHLMMEAMEYPEQFNIALGNLETNSNPYGFGAHERADWAEGLDIKIGEKAEYIYFVGCAASFDERNQKVARATISLLNEAGLDVGILGMDEGCSGDPARRMGNEYLFQMMAEMNVATFQEMGVKRIIASCPHCFHTIGKEYKDFGAEDLEVLHHSEILATLQKEGKLPQMEESDREITFHDPCYLGRIGGILQEPRDVINGPDVEVERTGQDSFCCGAGGAQMWLEEDPDKRVNEIRAKELADTGCNTIAVGCPFCSVMLEDGMKTIGKDLEIMDIAELLWEQIKAKDDEIQEKIAESEE
ncbi:MAG: (Fe-S)-binding protein [Euryarchaeota archaeon]|nr:(Fe-S)-binding protein [Euryarchaeota archaeon]